MDYSEEILIFAFRLSSWSVIGLRNLLFSRLLPRVRPG